MAWVIGDPGGTGGWTEASAHSSILTSANGMAGPGLGLHATPIQVDGTQPLRVQVDEAVV
jgi:hypothetical protein